MTLRKTEEQEVRELLALRPTDDLTDDERRRVDEALLYSEECRKELAGYERCLAVLHAAAAEPAPTDGRPSLWPRVEPRLGPARRFAPRRMFAAIPTSWMTVAVMLLAVGNLYLLTGSRTQYGGQMAAVKPSNVIRTGDGVSTLPNLRLKSGGETFVNARYPVLVDPRDERGRVRPLLGLVVFPCEGDDCGVEVSSILEDTSAEEAGLQVGDIIVSVDGKKVRSPGCMISYLKQHSVGQRIEIVYYREGRQHTVNVFLGGIVRMGERDFIIKKSPIPREMIDQQ
jgi:hypothetical protein